MAPKEQDAASKNFREPSSGMAGVYIYRNSWAGKALKKKLSLDGVVLGETSNQVYFHKEISPGTHTITTESEFGDNLLSFNSVSGKIYYFRQYIKMGVFVGGSGIESVTEEEGQKNILQCSEAK